MSNWGNQLFLTASYNTSNSYTELFLVGAGQHLQQFPTPPVDQPKRRHHVAEHPNYTTYVHNPPFAHVGAPNLNGSTNRYEEVIGLGQFPARHPNNWPFLVMLNPNNEPGDQCVPAAASPSRLWEPVVSTGGTSKVSDGDGKDEVVGRTHRSLHHLLQTSRR